MQFLKNSVKSISNSELTGKGEIVLSFSMANVGFRPRSLLSKISFEWRTSVLVKDKDKYNLFCLFFKVLNITKFMNPKMILKVGVIYKKKKKNRGVEV